MNWYDLSHPLESFSVTIAKVIWSNDIKLMFKKTLNFQMKVQLNEIYIIPVSCSFNVLQQIFFLK